MSRLDLKKSQAIARKRRVRSKVSGTADRPRLAVKISNKSVSAQLIDDKNGVTVASSNQSDSKITKTELAKKVGEDIAVAAAKKKITAAILDRREKKFHGRLKTLTEAANKKGLKV